MTKKEAAEFLEISIKSLEKYMSKERVKFTHIQGKYGKEVYFDEEEVERFKIELGDRKLAIGVNLLKLNSDTVPPSLTEEGIANSTQEVISLLKEIADGLSKENKAIGLDINQKVLLTIDEVVGLTSLPPGAIKSAIKKGELKAVKVGRSRRVKAEDFQSWVKGL